MQGVFDDFPRFRPWGLNIMYGIEVPLKEGLTGRPVVDFHARIHGQGYLQSPLLPTLIGSQVQGIDYHVDTLIPSNPAAIQCSSVQSQGAMNLIQQPEWAQFFQWYSGHRQPVCIRLGVHYDQPFGNHITGFQAIRIDEILTIYRNPDSILIANQ